MLSRMPTLRRTPLTPADWVPPECDCLGALLAVLADVEPCAQDNCQAFMAVCAFL